MKHTYRAAHSFAEYININPDPMSLDLHVMKHDDNVYLFFHTCEYGYARSILNSLPRARYRGEAAIFLMHLFVENGYIINGYTNDNTPAMLLGIDEQEAMHESFMAECVAQKRKIRLMALLAPAYDDDEADAQQSSPCPSEWQDSFINPNQLLEWSRQTVQYLNDDVSEELESHVKYISRRHPTIDKREALLAIISRYVYTCDDTVEVQPLKESHFHPFTFAGWWIELPKLPYAPLSVGIAVHDTRRPGCLFQMSIQRRFTDEICFFRGLERLYIAPTLRAWVEKHGQPHPTKQGLVLVAAAELTWEFGQKADNI